MLFSYLWRVSKSHPTSKLWSSNFKLNFYPQMFLLSMLSIFLFSFIFRVFPVLPFPIPFFLFFLCFFLSILSLFEPPSIMGEVSHHCWCCDRNSIQWLMLDINLHMYSFNCVQVYLNCKC